MLPKVSKKTSVIALGIAFSGIKFTFFLSYFLGRFVLQLYRKICLFFFSDLFVFLISSLIRMFVKNSIFVLQIFEKQWRVFAWLTLHKSQQTFSYLWKFTWEKGIGERKVHNPLKWIVCFLSTSPKIYNICILPRCAWNAILLWIQTPREIAPFLLKHMKNCVPMMTIRPVLCNNNKIK